MCWPWVNGKRGSGFASPAVTGSPKRGVPAWVTPGILQTPWVPHAAFTPALQHRDVPVVWLLLVPQEVDLAGKRKHKGGGRSSGGSGAALGLGIWGGRGQRLVKGYGERLVYAGTG